MVGKEDHVRSGGADTPGQGWSLRKTFKLAYQRNLHKDFLYWSRGVLCFVSQRFTRAWFFVGDELI